MNINNKLIIKIFNLSGVISILLLIFACFFIGCNNQTAESPGNGNPPIYAGWIDLHVTPNYIGSSSSTVTISYLSKVTENSSVSGILFIKDMNGCEAKRYEGIVLNNEKIPQTYNITPSQFNTNCNSINKVYEVYISYTINSITKESQHITFVYGNPTLSNCLSGEPNNITFEYDYMNNTSINPTVLFDFLYYPLAPFTTSNQFLSNFNAAFNNATGCNTTISFSRNSGVYSSLTCQTVDEAGLILALKTYCNLNRNNSGQYIVSADKLRNAPTINYVDYNTVLGVTPQIGPDFPDYRPCFVCYGNINGYGTIDRQKFSMWTAAHEIGHSRGINENESHSPNETCCVMKNSISGCYSGNTTNFYFCQYHRCQIYNNSTNTNFTSKTNKTNINQINF